MPERAPVDVTMDRLRRRIRPFEAAWAVLPVSQQRVLVLRCDGRSLQEVGQHLGITPQTANAYAKRVLQTMREATGVGGVSALCWLYGYSRALLDMDEQVMRASRAIPIRHSPQRSRGISPLMRYPEWGSRTSPGVFKPDNPASHRPWDAVFRAPPAWQIAPLGRTPEWSPCPLSGLAQG